MMTRISVTDLSAPAACPAPLLAVAGGADGEGEAAASPGSFAGGRPGLRRILVVEDDWFIGLEIETILKEAGHEVVDVVATADLAVRRAMETTPDLVLMDIRLMGPRDGIDAALEIRSRADIPCIFVSAHQDEATRRRAEASAPAGWVAKPFSHAQLLAAIAAAGAG
ncbi:response regulator [Lutibaculum baratangense]|uniref:Response regulator receiver protein n=1 Tax=Lutibaculum baratangense AMV1 TaxID=631454 RepID=V4RJM0_9HYPH|nr:response regulator [Lutibaculum baratangense]ESR25519.1 Response regulator receiver protein [Lutibaculum baratangense AMV1]